MDTTKTAYSNPFFYTVPPGTLYFSLVIAVLAAVVASQALITSTFQLLSQVMRLSYFPNVKVIHTSKLFHYHIYIPAANWLLMICTVAVTAIFDNVSPQFASSGQASLWMNTRLNYYDHRPLLSAALMVYVPF